MTTSLPSSTASASDPLLRLALLPDGWNEYTESRKAACEDDPLLFALTYLPHHLRSPETGDEITFSEVHTLWAEHAKEWMDGPGGPQEHRDAFVGPRSVGKSTWWFLILPLWAAAFGHLKFIAAFSDSATQAETHLQTLKHELDSNELLRRDFPMLCKPGRRPRGTQIADNRAMMFAASGFVFAARGIDSGNLGLKVGHRRPDMLILDDVEPGESNYSGDQVKKRLGTIRDVIFPLNVNARVVIVGTVTMPGSIIHRLVQSVRLPEGPERDDFLGPKGDGAWIGEENVTVHYSPPIVVAEDGTEDSIWPGRWPMEFLASIRHTRSFAKNYANDPRGYEGDYWSEEDFRYGELENVTRRLISVDPAVTTKKSSDPTGIAVIGMAPEIVKEIGGKRRVVTPRRVQVEHAEAVRLTGSALRKHVLKLIERCEEDGRPVGLVYVETNQGGDLWTDSVFHAFPVKVATVHQEAKKEVRAADALSWYQRGRVWHTKRLNAAEEQMISFPAAPNDDMVDAIGAGVLRFLDPPKKARASVTSVSTV